MKGCTVRFTFFQNNPRKSQVAALPKQIFSKSFCRRIQAFPFLCHMIININRLFANLRASGYLLHIKTDKIKHFDISCFQVDRGCLVGVIAPVSFIEAAFRLRKMFQSLIKNFPQYFLPPPIKFLSVISKARFG